jgi:hypothetical protein
MALIGDTPYYTCISYLMPPMGILVAGCILELDRIWQPHCQDKQHTHTEAYIYSQMEITHSIIFTN